MPQLQIFLSDDNRIVHDLNEEHVTVGRLADNMLQIEDDSVSSHHAELFVDGEQYHLRDLNSTNGTFVNAEQVTDAILQQGDEVRFGRVEAIFSGEAASAPVQPPPEFTSAVATVASQSARPETFVSSSPVPRSDRTKDPLATALYGVAGLGILSLLVSIYFVFAMQGSA